MDWNLADWIPMFRTCGILLVWTFIVAGIAMGVEKVLARAP